MPAYTVKSMHTNLPQGFSIAGASTPAAIRAVWDRDNAAYGDANISLESLQAWFNAYPAGGLYVWRDGKIAAGFGLWPLNKDAYEGLRNGTLDEDSIGPDQFAPTSKGQRAAYWNLAGFFVEPEFRGSWVLPTMLAAGFDQWSRSGHAANECSVLSLALSAAGARTLLRMGFAPVSSDLPIVRHELRLLLPAGLLDMQSRIGAAFCHRFN